jgi:hypothetical protein
MTRKSDGRGSIDAKAGRGRPANPIALAKRTVEIPDDLWAWALIQPEGGARLIRDLLALERKRRQTTQPPPLPTRDMAVATPGGVMVAAEVPDGIVLLFEEELAVQCLYDGSWGRLLIQVPSRIDPLKARKAKVRQQEGMTDADNESSNTIEAAKPHAIQEGN